VPPKKTILPPSDAQPADRDRWRRSAGQLAEGAVYVFVGHRARFLDPLVPVELETLVSLPAAEREQALEILEEWIPLHAAASGPAIYFPVPIARGRAAGTPDEELVSRFRYDLIQVDLDQRWSWRGQPVAERTRAFFLEHLYWQPAVGRYAFEYRVHDSWWDKSYLDAKTAPWRVSALELEVEPPQVVLETGRRTPIGGGFRLDERDRLLVSLAAGGEAMLSSTVSFQVLRHAADDLRTVQLSGRRYPLEHPLERGSHSP
jgi:hypothetical protein